MKACMVIHVTLLKVPLSLEVQVGFSYVRVPCCPCH